MFLFLTSWFPKLNMASKYDLEEQNNADLEPDFLSLMPNLPSLPSFVELSGRLETTQKDNALGGGTKDCFSPQTTDPPQNDNLIDLTDGLDITEPHPLEETDDDGDTLLHSAIISQKPQLALLMVDMIKKEGHRRILNVINNERQTPLHLAALIFNSSIILALLKNGADITARDSKGRTFMHILCENVKVWSRDSQLCELLLNKQWGITSFLTPFEITECLRIKNFAGQTCFHVACETGNICAARCLVDIYEKQKRCLVDMEDMDFLNIPDSKSGKRALHVAAENGHTSVVKLLAGSHGVDLEKRTYNGMTALIAAYHRGHHNCVGALRNAHAKFSTKEIKKFGPYKE